jgi:CRP-like cAMP-binding protein
MDRERKKSRHGGPATEYADPRNNRLLAALPEEQLQAWQPLFVTITLSLGDVLYEPGSPLNHIYFPVSGIVSILEVLANGASAQIAVVGCEGLVGMPVFIGGGPARNSAVVQSAGVALRIDAEVVRSEFQRGGPVMHLFLRFTQALIAQMSQTAVCNRHHTPEQQLCRYLLLSLDRLHGSEVVITQELIAHMLGLRRETISDAARKMQDKGVVQCRRGHIQVVDRAALERSACECYAAVKGEYDRLLPAGP